MMAVLESAGRVDFQRLPGVTFLPRPPARRPLLPRLDVAAFTGFAERGPLNVPVPVEDANVYAAVFGGALELARRRRAPGLRSGLDRQAGNDGEQVTAHLPRTVEQFFANRGRRCYVVRVAGRRAEAARLRLAGMVALNGRAGPKLAAVSAASPGAWGARLRLAGRLAVTPLPLTQTAWATAADGTITLEFAAEALRRSGAAGLAAGDVLRLRYADAARYLALVTAVARPTAAPGTAPRVLVTLGAGYEALPGFAASPPEEVSRAELLTIEGPADLVTTGPLLDSDAGSEWVLTPEDAPRLSRGDVLRLHLASQGAGEPGYLVRIEEIRGLPGSDGGSPPEPLYAARFSEALRPAPLRAPASPPDLTGVDLLRLDLLLRLGGTPAANRAPSIQGSHTAFMADLAFNPGHPRFWGDAVLLESSPLRAAGQGAAGQGGAGQSSRALSARPIEQRSNPYADSAAWQRWLTRDPYDVLPQSALGPSREMERAGARSFNTVTALAGLLAPAGSHLGLPANAVAAGGTYADAEEELALTYLPLGLPEIIDEADTAQFRPPEPGREGSDDLARFDPAAFYDRFLAPPGAPGGSSPFGETHRTLLQTAFDLHYVQGRELRGLHSLLFIEEVAVVAAPDACHDPWGPGEPEDAPIPPAPEAAPTVTPCPPAADFAACNRPPVLTPGPATLTPYYGPWDRETPVIVRGEGFTSSLTTTLLFGLRPAEDLQVVSSTELRATAPTGVRPGPVDVTVRNEFGAATLTGGFIYTESSSAPDLPVSEPLGANDLVADQPFLYIHEALAAFCQGRADAVCLLSLPQSFDVSRCIEWQQALRRRLELPDLGEGFATDEPREIADLSYAAVYHPWLAVSDPGASVPRLLPPDGALAGVIAARELARQAWVAPANVRLERVLGLAPALSDDAWAELFARRFNLVRPEAGGFAPMSAHTLSGERDWLQLSVRRLMILLRKAAFDLGMDFVFQTNNEVFREGVRVALTDFLRLLFEQGAFAGRTEAESFRVIADATVNPRQSTATGDDQGRLIVVIQVAPSQPMEFITVQLVRSGEGELLIV